MLPKSVNVSKYLVTVTLFPYTEGVTVTEDVCTNLLFKQPRSAARLSKMPVPSYELCAPFPSLLHATTANYGLLSNLRGNPELPQAEF